MIVHNIIDFLFGRVELQSLSPSVLNILEYASQLERAPVGDTYISIITKSNN